MCRAYSPVFFGGDLPQAFGLGCYVALSTQQVGNSQSLTAEVTNPKIALSRCTTDAMNGAH
jgi:hypothetical protein